MSTSTTEVIDYAKRDGKRVPSEDDGAFALKQLGLAVASIVVGGPIALVGLAGLGINKLSGNKSGAQTADGIEKFEFPPVSPCLVPDLKPVKDREFDVIMFGATGFTGGLAAEYLTKQYGTSKTVKWAIAGRRKEALESVKAACLALQPDLDLTVLDGVDSGNEESLQRMCARTRVVITTVGPFVKYGTPLVRACISTNTSCCDITGEVDWHAGLIDAYDEAARKAGCKIVSFCGHDCVPWDLMAYKLAKQLGGEHMRTVHMEDELYSKPSGGTLATVLEHISAPGASKAKSSRGFNPLLLTPTGEKSAFELQDACVVYPTKFDNLWGGPFVMALVNAQTVRRGNALNGYGEHVVYTESRVAPSFGVLMGRYMQLAALGPVLFFPAVLRDRLLPKPGAGPSVKDMKDGFLQVTGTAEGVNGTKVKARIYFPTCPGYRDTARMLVETGLSVALSPETCDRSGVLTPGTCCPDTLLERLVQTGTEFSFYSNL